MKRFILLAFVAFLVLGCKKIQIENNLWSGVGEWNIAKTVFETDYFPISVPNAGTVWFKKDKTGRMVYTLLGNTTDTKFTYTVKKDQLVTVDKTEGGENYGKSTTWDIVEWKHNKLTVSTKEMTLYLEKE